MLVVEALSTPEASFRVKQANTDAEQLMNPVDGPLIGATLDQLPTPFNSAELHGQLKQVFSKGVSTQCTLLRPLVDSMLVFDCRLLKADSHLLVLSVVASEPEDMDSLEQVLEAMPAGLALFRAVRNDKQEIIDFQAVLCNQSGARLSRQSRQDILTKPISQRYADMKAYELFHQYVSIVTTGEPLHQRLYLPNQDIWLDISVVKYGDGVLVSFQDITQGQKTTALLESVMNSSPAAVRYYESIRDEAGQLIDFMTSTGNELAAYLPFRATQSTFGTRLLDLYPYLKENGLFERYVAVVESGQSDHFETSRTLEDRVVWFDCMAVRHGNGFVLTSLDITARKEAQLAQQRQGNLLQTVLDNSLTGIARLKTRQNPVGQIVDFTLEQVNATLAKTLGKSPDAVAGKLLSELMPHQMTNGLFERYAEVVRTGEPQRFELSNPAATIWYDVSAVAIADGLIVTFMDITASKMAQLDLEEQADLIKGVLNSSTSSILVLEPMIEGNGQPMDFLITLANPATGRLFFPFLGHDFTQEKTRTYTLLTLFPEVKERALYAALMTIVNTGETIQSSIEYPELGLTYDYDLRPFRQGVLMITTDSTPLRVYQQQLEANNIALSRSNEYLQQFAYVASHDLQEPLRKIQSFGDMLLTQYAKALDATGQDILRRQQHAAQRMQSLVKDLLNYSRLSTEQLPFQPISLQWLIEEVISDLETTIQETGAIVRVDPLPIIKGNSTQLRQLLQNLMTNALKFSKPGQPPRVTVDSFLLTADRLPQPRLTPDQGQWVALRVSDEGIGFDTLYKERIFELFQRLHGRSQYTGTGIGLAVVKKVVENHRGQIMAQSQPGEGATFTIYLPMT
ncbi:histidine kinase [Spirosoma radiotolerans]|uniref:histidine kinase n=1 Tax=Spirosoma radiotolerans TaxID=1379870 RepID=A0A0E4A1K1_9BACT|nr:histidine kinase [Spirosoma radiotolerans]